MGLDMYAEITKEHPAHPVDFEPTTCQEIKYWRKHPNLHGWMEQLYFEKGGTSSDFNCATVVLDLNDLKRLETAIRQNRLPETSGFFFGESHPDEKPGDLAFIDDARRYIREGYTVFYSAWW